MLVNSGNKYFSVLLLFGAFEKVVQEFFIGINARFCRSKETRGRIEIREMSSESTLGSADRRRRGDESKYARCSLGELRCVMSTVVSSKVLNWCVEVGGFDGALKVRSSRFDASKVMCGATPEVSGRGCVGRVDRVGGDLQG